MKKLVSLLLISSLLVFSFVSCGERNREYDKEVVLSSARELIEKSKNLNEIYWGRGISYVEDLNYSEGYYFMANPLDCKRHGFETIAELKDITREVFSKSYCESIFNSVLSSSFSENSIASYARYFQKFSDIEQTQPEYIMVYSRATVLLDSEVEYLYDTMYDVGSVGEVVYVMITAKVTQDGKSQTRELKIGLIEEKDGFRIHTPTYVKYYEEN